LGKTEDQGIALQWEAVEKKLKIGAIDYCTHSAS